MQNVIRLRERFMSYVNIQTEEKRKNLSDNAENNTASTSTGSKKKVKKSIPENE